MMHQPDLFSAERFGDASKRPSPRRALAPAPPLDRPAVIARVADFSTRPRYTMLVLDLLVSIAGPSGEAGPYVLEAGREVPVRDWLTDALIPVAQRDQRRLAIVGKVRGELERGGRLPPAEVEAARVIDAEVRNRVRSSGRSNISRATSDLLRAGLLTRFYKGWRVDHHNRGAQREAVYVLPAEVRRALGH